jgi:pyrimidine-specific ribonucleoside hydrolase
LLRAALGDGIAHPLSVRQLDGDKERNCDEIELRDLLVGPHGSIVTLRDVLEDFMVTSFSKGKSLGGYPVAAGEQSSSSKARRWGNSKQVNNDKVAGAAIGKARAVTLKNVEELKHQHGDSFISLGQQAKAWIETSFAEHGKGDKILSKLGELTKPNEEHYYAALLTFKDRILASTALNISGHAQFRKSQRNSTENRWQNNPGLRPFVFDMETGDPDDVLTLLFLASHPDVDLRAVAITPGSQEQVALVRWLLQEINLEHVRLGAQRWPENATKPVNLTAQFYQSFGRSPQGKPECERADQVLLECCDHNVTLVTGAPLHNLGDALQLDGFKLGLLVAQGGFAGQGVVPTDMQMDKFKGMMTCPTWNFGGNIKAAEAALASICIARKICVSKNVCHSVVYDADWHRALQVAAEKKSQEDPDSRSAIALSMMYRTMDQYLQHKPGGKKLHDPLALAVALNEAVCELVEVQLFCQKGKWGSRLSPGSNVWISVAYDAAAFLATLLD